jgi:hypothetical protein
MVALGELARGWVLEIHLRTDARLVRVPEATVVYAVRPTRWGTSARRQRKSMVNALLYKKRPVLYRWTIQAALAMTYGARDRPA